MNFVTILTERSQPDPVRRMGTTQNPCSADWLRAKDQKKGTDDDMHEKSCSQMTTGADLYVRGEEANTIGTISELNREGLARALDPPRTDMDS